MKKNNILNKFKTDYHTYLNENKCVKEKLKLGIEKLEEKYNFLFPEDIKQFYYMSNGMCLNQCSIAGIVEAENSNNKTIDQLTDWIKQFHLEHEKLMIENGWENYIVIGKIFEHGYVSYF